VFSADGGCNWTLGSFVVYNKGWKYNEKVPRVFTYTNWERIFVKTERQSI